MRANLAEVVFDNLPVSQSAIVAGSLFCAFIFYVEAASPRVIMAWVLVVNCIAVARLFQYTRFKRKHAAGQPADSWLQVFNILAVAMGLAWSAAIVVVAPPDSFMAVVFALGMLCAINAGTTATLSPCRHLPVCES